jgi:hypothetical protein
MLLKNNLNKNNKNNIMNLFENNVNKEIISLMNTKKKSLLDGNSLLDDHSSIHKLLNIMYIKRFCIPSNFDSILSCQNKFLCNNFNHISCFLHWKFIWIEDG